MCDYRIPIRRACKLVLLHRSMWYYQSQARDEQAIRKRMREIAMTRVRYGLDRIHILLRREGWRDNRNRFYRLCGGCRTDFVSDQRSVPDYMMVEDFGLEL